MLFQISLIFKCFSCCFRYVDRLDLCHVYFCLSKIFDHATVMALKFNLLLFSTAAIILLISMIDFNVLLHNIKLMKAFDWKFHVILLLLLLL